MRPGIARRRPTAVLFSGKPHGLAHQAPTTGAGLARLGTPRGRSDPDAQQFGDAFRRALKAKGLRQPLNVQLDRRFT